MTRGPSTSDGWTSGGWTEVARRTVHEAHGRGLDAVEFAMPDGRREDFYIATGGSTVSVLPVTRDGRVLLVRQYRPGPQAELYELPGGYIDDGEDEHAAAARELLEETGHAGRLRFCCATYADAYSSVQKYCFAAVDCHRVLPGPPDESEVIAVVPTPLEEFRALLRTGRMTDVDAGYLCLDALGLL